MDGFKSSEPQLRALTDVMAEGLLLFDQNGVLLYINQEAERLLGWFRAEALGVRIFKDLLDPALPHEEACFLERALRTRAVVRVEGETIYRLDGTSFSAQAVASPVIDKGVVFGCALALVDITESLHLREGMQKSLMRIRKQRRFYKKIYDGVLDGVLLQDESGKIIHANLAAEDLLGTTLGELTADFYEVEPTAWLDEEGQPFFWQNQVQRTLSQPPEQREVLHTIYRVEPEPRWLSLHTLALPQEKGQTDVVLTTLRDISQLKYTEQREGILYGITQRVLAERPLSDIFQYLCDELVQNLGYAGAAVGLKGREGSIQIMAQNGLPSSLLPKIEIRWDDTPKGQGGFGKAIRSGLPYVYKVQVDPSFNPWLEFYEAFSILSEATFPLLTQGQTLGVLALYSRNGECFYPSRVAHMQSFADQVALALWTSEDRRKLRLQNTALTASANAIVITDRAGQIIWGNPAFARLSGYELEKVLGQTLSFLCSGHQDQAFYGQLWQTILAGQIWHGELVNRRADGVLYSEEMTITPVKAEDQEITHFIAVKQDVSERLAIQKALADSEEQFRDMFETMSSAVAVFKITDDGQDFICTNFNRAAEKIENISRSQGIGSALTEVFPLAKKSGLFELCLQVYHNGKRTRFPAFVYENQRGYGWSEGVIYKLSTGNIVLLYDDVTQRVLDENALWQEKERALVTLASIGDAVLTTDVLGKVTYLNSVAETMTGWSNQEAQGLIIERVFDIYHEGSGQSLTQPIRQCLQEQRVIALANHAMLRNRNGWESFHIEDSAAPIKDREEQVIGAVLVFHDVSEKRALLRLLSHQANHDPLTDLPNRLLFKDRVHQAIFQGKRRREIVAVFFLDLDDFKLVNDTLGHAAGDSLLCQVGERLKTTLRQEDTVARQGGDEFLILLPELFSEQQAAQVAQKVLEALSTPFQLCEQETYISASLGIALFPVDGEDPELLIQQADMAMYQTKVEGRNHYHFYTHALNERLSERLALQNEMRRALERQEFVLYYQPQYRLSDGQLCGMEALVRWQHPERGFLLPSKFISIAEDSGLILALGEWVLRTACIQNKHWQNSGYPPVRVAVNISARQFRQKNLVRQIARILVETELNPEWLELEITESLSMENVALSVETLKQLKSMGIHLSIDDFGTGFSSLSYLRRFSLDTLKIDRSFITELYDSQDGQMIVLTIIQLAQNLGLKVIAEGVETEEQYNFLRAKGCDAVQGFLLSKPVPVHELVNCLKENRLDH